MLKKTPLIFTFILSVITCAASGQGLAFNTSASNDIGSNFKHLSPQQLLDIGNYYRIANNTDAALAYYGWLINTVSQSTDNDDQKRVLDAYNNSALIHYNMGDYRTAYELLLRALQLSEISNNALYISRIYSNIGNIYYRFNKYDFAKLYYSEALNTCQDTATISIILNNLGYLEVKSGNLDSAFLFLGQSLQIMEQHSPSVLHIVLHSLASLYKEKKVYDSAYYYYRLSLDHARKNNKIDQIAESLSDLGKLFFQTNQTDSAIFYINLSNAIASENDFLRILMENYLVLSEIAKSKGRVTAAFEYFTQYSNLKDSILNLEKITEVNQLQRLYEVSKTDQQIEQLIIERRVKEQTIRYHKNIQYIMWTVLMLISAVLVFVFFQNKKLNMAYKTLFEKNLKIIEFQQRSSESQLEKYQKSALTDEMQSALLGRIYTIMEDKSVICDAELSIEKLAELVQSNRGYVSQVINDVLKKNFRAFVNEYRIREAQRLFLEIDLSKYTLESIALMTGFKSRSTFNLAFKEVTGVSPGFYLKSMQNR
jgi:AraC-like DNA-binding protein/Tfp pilus assembly protein PilF